MPVRKRTLKTGSDQNKRTDAGQGNDGSCASEENGKLTWILVISFSVVIGGGLGLYVYSLGNVETVLEKMPVLYPIVQFVNYIHPVENKTKEIKEQPRSDVRKKAKSNAKSTKSNKAIKSNFERQLEAAENYLNKGTADSITLALGQFDDLIKAKPKSAEALHGKARCLDILSELHRSNEFLQRAIRAYQEVMELRSAPKATVLKAGRRCANRQSFMGWSAASVKTYRRLIELFPDDLSLYNDLGVAYLTIGKNEAGRQIFQTVLDKDPSNGFAQVHLGFVLKTTDNNPKGAIPLLQKGIDSGAPGVTDGRFYFHLGDAYMRVGNKTKAQEIHQQGADRGLYPSRWQRSLYNVDGLKARPWWPTSTFKEEVEILERNWKTIRDEGLANLDPAKGIFKDEDENLREKGDWKQFTLYQRGQRNDRNCQKAPRTCVLLSQMRNAATCSRGQIKFSVMQPGVRVWPHCGPTNCRLRAHLGLVVPEGPKIRVEETTKEWKEGKVVIFDDSFEHEVWHDGTSVRLVLIVDFWHPELTNHQRATLPAI